MKNLMKSTTRNLLRQTIACLLAFLIINGPVWAINSTDVIGTPVNATVSTSGNTTTVDVLANRSVIEWSNFNTTSAELLEFQRAGGDFAVLNRILSGSATQFDGMLNGNQGHIIVINQHGIVFGPTAEVTAHRFTASTLGLEMTDDDFLAGSNNFAFKTGDARGRIALAAGAEITAEQIELLAHQISNNGLISGTGGIVLLATGDEIYLASESDDIIVKINLPPDTGRFNYSITNETTGTIQNDSGKVVLAAGDTFAQAISGIQNHAYAVNTYNIEQRGTVQTSEFEAAAVQQIALRGSGSTEAETIKMGAQKIDIRQNLDTVGDMIIDSDNNISVYADLNSGGDMHLNANQTTVLIQGQTHADGEMSINAGTNMTLLQGASSDEAMTLTAGNRIVTYGNLESKADMTVTANETWAGKDILAADDLAVNSDLFLFGNTDQTLASEDGSVHTAGQISKSTEGSIYIAAHNNARLDGDITADLGGVSVIAETGRIHTGEGGALNITISGYSNHIENAGVDLPYNNNDNGNGNGESNGGKAAIVLQSQADLILGSEAELYAGGSYAATPENGVDDRPGVNFLDEDAVIGGYERDQGIPSDVAIYAGSTAGNVIINESATLSVVNDSEIGDATVVLDAWDTVSLTNASVLTGEFRLEAASRISEWLFEAVDNDRLPVLSEVEAVLGEGNYARRGAGLGNLSITDGRQWVLENPDTASAPLAVLEIPELKGCPVEMQAAAIELGISDDTLQMTIRNSLAMNPNIQPCEACASLVTAATILNDADGIRMAAMNQIFNTLAPPDAPFTPEVSASVVTAFAQLGDQDRQYALAAEYIDAFVRYVAILDTELKAPIGDPVAFALEKHGEALMGENANPNMAAYVLTQVMPEGI